MLKDNKKVSKIIKMGSEIAGASAGGALGYFAGGPGGAAGAAALGIVIAKGAERVLVDISNRFLSQREEIKIGATTTFALAKIKAYLEDGFTPRNDRFFEWSNNQRPPADEILEGVLLRSKNEHEEKKTRYLGNIFANVAFDSKISLGEANHILQVAANLTYRQMCALAFIRSKSEIKEIRLPNESNYEHVDYETMSILQEIYEMHNMGLVACQSNPEHYDALLGWTNIIPANLVLTNIGERYFQVMGLNDIELEEMLGVGNHLAKTKEILQSSTN